MTAMLSLIRRRLPLAISVPGTACLMAAVCLLSAVSILSALGSTASVAAATPTGTPAAQVEHYLEGLSSWSADFKQTISDSDDKLLRSAAGHLYLQRPGKFRWDYSEPSEQLVLADGKKLWFYDKDLAQANVRDMDATLASTPAVLLSGTGSVGTQFDITALPPGDGLQWYELKPKHQDSDFHLIKIGFADGELAQMWLADKLGQVTRLSFSNTKRNQKFAPDLFSFTPPTGVDVIGRGSP
jgi:outer membrane lipoprotein carrier protein